MELQGRCRRTGCLKTQAVNRGDRLTLTIARRMNVDERMVRQVRQVQGTGDRELISAVLEGKLSLDDACEIAAQHMQQSSPRKPVIGQV